MTTLALPDKTADQILAEVRRLNDCTDLISAEIRYQLTEKLGLHALSIDDPEVQVKVLKEMREAAQQPEKRAAQKAGNALAAAILQIVLDDTPQVAPVKRRAVPMADVVDVKPADPLERLEVLVDSWGDQ